MKIRDEDIEPKTRKRLQSAMEASWANPTPSPAELHARQLTQRHLNHTQTKPFLLYSLVSGKSGSKPPFENIHIGFLSPMRLDAFG
jgi:hypothetical protein